MQIAKFKLTPPVFRQFNNRRRNTLAKLLDIVAQFLLSRQFQEQLQRTSSPLTTAKKGSLCEVTRPEHGDFCLVIPTLEADLFAVCFLTQSEHQMCSVYRCDVWRVSKW